MSDRPPPELISSRVGGAWVRTASTLRSGVGRLPGVLLLVAAGAGFIVLSHGAAFGTLPVTGFAELVPRAIAPVAAGRLTEVSVKLGQQVKAGDVLAELDRRVPEARLAALKAGVAQASAQLAAQRGIQDLQVMRAELWALRSRAEERGARAELSAIEKQVNMLETLSNDHLVTPLQMSDAIRMKVSLDARVQLYDQAVDRGQAGLSAKAYSFAQSHAKTVADRLAPYEATVHAAEAELRQAEIAIEETTLKAPVDGRVAVILHHTGEVLAAGTEVITLVSGRPGAILVTAPEKIAAGLSPGSKVKIRRSGFFRRAVEGVVLELSPEIDQAPPRAWLSPSAPLWGRRLVVQASSLTGLLPGEAVSVQF